VATRIPVQLKPVPKTRQAAYNRKLKSRFDCCPKCGSDRITSTVVDLTEDDDTVAECKTRCLACKLRWTEQFVFAVAVEFEEPGK